MTNIVELTVTSRVAAGGYRVYSIPHERSPGAPVTCPYVGTPAHGAYLQRLRREHRRTS